MKERYILVASVFVVTLFLLVRAGVLDQPSGAVVTNADDVNYALTVNDIASDFLGISSIEFPRGTCADIAKDLYGNIAYDPVDVNTGFNTEGRERILSTNFVTDRVRRYGTLDISYGPTVLAKSNANTLISINMEAVVRVPKEDRTNYVSLDFYGYSQGTFQVNRGRFSTPSLDCAFIAENGVSYCDCEAHSISGIEVAGITAVRPPETSYLRIEQSMHR